MTGVRGGPASPAVPVLRGRPAAFFYIAIFRGVLEPASTCGTAARISRASSFWIRSVAGGVEPREVVPPGRTERKGRRLVQAPPGRRLGSSGDGRVVRERLSQ